MQTMSNLRSHKVNHALWKAEDSYLQMKSAKYETAKQSNWSALLTVRSSNSDYDQRQSMNMCVHVQKYHDDEVAGFVDVEPVDNSLLAYRQTRRRRRPVPGIGLNKSGYLLLNRLPIKLISTLPATDSLQAT